MKKKKRARMSVQDDLNNNPEKYILYYCNVAQSDPTVYNKDAVDVADYIVDPDLEITTWKLEGKYSAPTTEQMLSYTLLDVMSFYNGFYQLPFDVGQYQAKMLTSTQIASMRTDSSMVDMEIFNTTAQKRQYLLGNLTWANVN